jgi:hypothetical protein
MKVKCNNCSEATDVTLDSLIFENEDEEIFATYLSLEISKSNKEKEQ